MVGRGSDVPRYVQRLLHLWESGYRLFEGGAVAKLQGCKAAFFFFFFLREKVTGAAVPTDGAATLRPCPPA